MGKPFVNLHTHSFYSLLHASASPKDIITKAASLGCPAVALTDSGAGYGLVDFYEQAEKNGKVKPILGAEMFIAQDSRFEQRMGIDGQEGYIVVLARNKQGYQNLLKLVSHGYLEGIYSYSNRPRIDFELLEKYKEGLIVLTGGVKGSIGKIFFERGESKAIEYFNRLQNLFKDNLYIELIANTSPDQKEVNQFKYQLAKNHNQKMIITSDAHFTTEENEEATNILYCISTSQTLTDHHFKSPITGSFFKSFEEMCKELHYFDESVLEEARQNTLSIAETIDFKLEFNQNLLPQFKVPNGETEASQLRKLCEENIPKRYGKSSVSEIKERLEYELSIIGKMGFEAYFLIVADLINFARKNEIAVGPGRGSAAGSIVAYLLGITNIDPIKYELLFERFLNPERISMPDIDIDFSDERREEVFQYVIEKYGAEKVSKVCTFGTLSAKAALKDVGRALGVPFSEMNAFTKILPNKPGFMLENAPKIPDFKTLIDTKSYLKKVFSIAQKLEGCVRHVSVHACAVIIGRDDLTQSTPLQWAPTSDQVKITQFPYQQLEHLGLLKMDFLGLKNLSVLEKTLVHIKSTTNQDLDLNTIPIDDTKTFEMLSRGETTGVFQFESSGMRRYLRDLRPTEFEDLVAMNALYRPGPMEYIPIYIRGKHNPKKVRYAHKILKPILQKTYGIAVYQEQVMKIAQVFSGFTLGEADILRKAIGKKIISILGEQRQKFINGAIKNGFDEKLAIKMFDEVVVPFAGYGFNRSHAVCYARIAYETAYLRANYPVEFMSAMMTTDRHNTDRIVLEMNECQNMGIEVLPPSINQSGAYFTIIRHPNSQEQTSLKDVSEPKQKIRFGLIAIKGLGEDPVNQIIQERKQNGSYKSLQDFARRVPIKLLNKKTLEALAFSGAFDEFGDRKAIVDSLDDLAKFAKEHQTKTEAGQMGLFGGIDSGAIEFTLKDSVADKKDILQWERDSLGLFVSDHPLKGLGEYFKRYGKLIGQLSEEEDKEQKRTIHGIVTSVRNIITKKGKPMAIVEIEDTSGKIEGAIFPQIYEKINKSALVIDSFIRVRGKIDERNGELTIIIDEIKAGNLDDIVLSEKKQKEPFLINIPDKTPREKVAALKVFLQEKKVGKKGSPVEIMISGERIKLPFMIEITKNIKTDIDKLFQ